MEARADPASEAELDRHILQLRVLRVKKALRAELLGLWEELWVLHNCAVWEDDEPSGLLRV